MRQFDCVEASAAIGELGYGPPDMENHDLHEHMQELARIFDVYVERNGKYKGVWRQYGALANLVRAAQKVDRLMSVWWHEVQPECNRPEHQDGHHGPDCFLEATRVPLDSEDLDDALDAINHLLFFVRCAREGNLFGTPPERPGDRWSEDMAVKHSARGAFSTLPQPYDNPEKLRLVDGTGKVHYERPAE